MYKIIIIVGIVVLFTILGFLGWQTLGQKNASVIKNPSQIPTNSQTSNRGNNSNEFNGPKKSAHFESNTPTHATVLAGVPINVVVDFNFDVAKGSSISIKNSEKEYGQGETIIDADPLAMRRNMDPNSPNGIYTVSYKACWADGSCHDGNFQFAIDRTKAAEFVDMRNKKEITVSLKNTTFNSQNIRVSVGTKVIWVNEDDMVHTVNTDSHPAHTYFTNQNSRNLNKGDKYSVTFEKTGIYLYHCTPHAAFMTGSILVE